jgi:long-subunit fatty acid transport protein
LSTFFLTFFKNLKPIVMMNKWIGLVWMSMISITLTAQGIEDLVRFSTKELHGTPRFVATGGAFGALGNDFSAIHVNPAGAAVFRRNEIGLSINYHTMNSNVNYFGQSANSDNFRLLVPSAGYVQTVSKPGAKNKVVFGITYNRTADYNGTQRVATSNGQGSILQFWTAQSNGLDLERIPDEPWLAYNAGLMWPVGDPNNPDYVFDANTNGVAVNHDILQTRSASEIGITVAGITQEKWHIGATLNIVSFDFFENSRYSERFPNPTDIRELNWNRELDQRGSGVNLRVGALYRVNQMVRLGISGTTPSFMRINEIYRTRIRGISDVGDLHPEGLEFVSRYSVRTPADLTTSAAFVFGKKGFISVDYRVANMASARFGRTSFVEGLDGPNAEAAEFLGLVNNIRIGGEFRIDNFFLRGGYNYTNGAFVADRTDGSMQVVTGGVGFRTKDFELNVALAVSNINQIYSPFPPVAPENATGTQTLTNTSFIIGFGYRF